MLKNRNSALLLGVSLVSGFGGNAMSLVGSIWVLSLTGSSSLAALVGFCVYLPSAFGPLLGTLVDRLPRQRLLVWTNLLTGACLLALLALRNREEIWILFVVMLAYGVCHVLLDAGESAILPASLPDGEIGRLNGLRMSVREGMKLLAPLAGAGLFAAFGGPPIAALVAATLVVSAWLYSLLRPLRPLAPRPGGRAVDGMRDGIRYLWQHRWLRLVVLAPAVAVPMSGFAMAASLEVISAVLHKPPAFLGILTSAQGAGSIVAGIVAGRLMARKGEAFLAGLGCLLFATSTVLRVVPSVPLAIACSVLTGCGLLWTVVAAMTAVQRHTDESLLGRVAATASSLTFAPVALAIPLGAAAVPAFGLVTPLVLTFLACAGTAVCLLRRPPAVILAAPSARLGSGSRS